MPECPQLHRVARQANDAICILMSGERLKRRDRPNF